VGFKAGDFDFRDVATFDFNVVESGMCGHRYPNFISTQTI
jgi:hypothetical protein